MAFELVVSQRYPSKRWELSARSIRDTLVQYNPDATYHATQGPWHARSARQLIERVQAHYGVENVSVHRKQSPKLHGFTLYVNG